MSTTARISAVSGRLLMSNWPGQTGRPKLHQARGVSAVPPCLAPSRLQIPFTNAVLDRRSYIRRSRLMMCGGPLPGRALADMLCRA